MKLLWNWRSVVKRAWSVRCTFAACVLSAIEFALPFVAPREPSGWFAAAAALCGIAAVIARLMPKPKTLP